MLCGGTLPPPIYLDHNATTPLDPRVRARVIAVLSDPDGQGNPSSVHAWGRRARAVVEDARRAVAAAVGCEALEVTFTSGGTEADNLAVLGGARALRQAGQPCGVLSSRIEHPAVLSACAQLAREGHTIAWVAVDAFGRITPEALATALAERPEIGLVSLSAANHELGNLYPIAALAAAARAARPGVLFHTDAVQALGKVAIDVREWDVDLMSVTAHKIYGPKGIGALIHRRHQELAPLIHGGPQERGRRGGTESPALIAGFGLAAELAASELVERAAAMSASSGRVIAGIEAIGGAQIFGDRAARVGNTVCVAFTGAEGQLLLIHLDLAGIMVSTGAACSSGSLEPSPVLLALGCSPEEARGALRISTGKDTSAAEIDALLAALRSALASVRG